jgi:hypothetical protein
MNSDLPSVADLIVEMRGLLSKVDQAMGRVFDLAKTLPDAERDYEHAYHSAILISSGTSSDKRKAEAVCASVELKAEFTANQITLAAARQYVGVLQTGISALQSISGALRSELDLAGKGPR